MSLSIAFNTRPRRQILRQPTVVWLLWTGFILFELTCGTVPLLAYQREGLLQESHTFSDKKLLNDQQLTAIDAAVEQEIETQKLVGVAIVIIRNNQIAYLKAYGFADRENDRPATIDTVFNWASNSKPVVAVLAMQLVQQGKLDLDADIRSYLKNFPNKGAKITTRHLLCHQSGFPHYGNGTIIGQPVESTSLEQLDPNIAMLRFIDSPLIHQPGQQYDYSSYAYVILSAVVQSAGEHPIAEQLNDRIVGPLKLKSFQLDLPIVESNLTKTANWAIGYRKAASGKVFRIPDNAHFWKHGAGGYKSNIQDFATWAVGLTTGKLVNKSIENQMWTPQKTNDALDTTYGLGFSVQSPVNTDSIALKVSHNGSQDETKTRMVLYPKQKNGVVVLCNCNHADPGKISTAIYQAIRK